jgi:hypothetical protein
MHRGDKREQLDAKIEKARKEIAELQNRIRKMIERREKIPNESSTNPAAKSRK